jgi:hypothetical protein
MCTEPFGRGLRQTWVSKGRCVAVLLGLTLAAGCGSAARSTPAAAIPSSDAPTTSAAPTANPAPVSVVSVLHSKAAAQAVVDALSRTVALPAGARQVSAAPSERLKQPSQESVVITRVESRRWFMVAATPAQVWASVTAHLLPALTCPPRGMGVVDTYGTTHVYALRCATPLSGRWVDNDVDVDAVTVGNLLGVLVDIQAIWVPPKTSYDVVPAGLTSARLSFTSGVEGLKNKAVSISGKGLASLRHAIDDAPVAPPQALPNSCPPGQGDATLTVSPRVAFDIDVYGCRTAIVLVDGKPETMLAYDPAPGATAHRLLGLPHYNWPP